VVSLPDSDWYPVQPWLDSLFADSRWSFIDETLQDRNQFPALRMVVMLIESRKMPEDMWSSTVQALRVRLPELLHSDRLEILR
jgi:hypothetical protein